MRLSRLTGFALISTGLASALMAMPRHTQATVTADLSGNLSRASDDGLSSTPNMDANATLSPDGKSVAFDSWRDGDGEIYVKSADGALPPLRLTRQAGFDSQPVWSPDGRRLAFISDRDGNDEIYVMDRRGPSAKTDRQPRARLAALMVSRRKAPGLHVGSRWQLEYICSQYRWE